MAEELKIGAGAAPTENVLKPIKLAFEKVLKLIFPLSLVAQTGFY
jgi:hypothetical protein